MTVTGKIQKFRIREIEITGPGPGEGVKAGNGVSALRHCAPILSLELMSRADNVACDCSYQCLLRSVLRVSALTAQDFWEWKRGRIVNAAFFMA